MWRELECLSFWEKKITQRNENFFKIVLNIEGKYLIALIVKIMN